MKETILEKLSGIEVANDVRILYACESGSRAWGFASPDSDYDVRFIYIHNRNHYLSIDNQRDVIELPVNEVLDIGGWDIRKALGLFYKTNAALYEWLQSPVVYRSDEQFHSALWANAGNYYSLYHGLNHYLSMTKSCYEGDLQGDEVKLKKYFYALRPILAAKWIIDKRELPPMEFDKLRVNLQDTAVQNQIDDLLKQKADANEKHTIKPVGLLQDFIASTMEECNQQKATISDLKGNREDLNIFFRQQLGIDELS
ncbi:MAG TPA: nucleotidyltransferase domain-containing protein [Chitinophagales bacterium]|nr:nucleotidyltransferase domain-containing protein [Chitinophagales bacterium]